MGRFKLAFTNYIEDHGDKPLRECPYEVQVMAYMMFKASDKNNTEFELRMKSVLSALAGQYEDNPVDLNAMFEYYEEEGEC